MKQIFHAYKIKLGMLCVAIVAALSISTSANATLLKVTITNNAQINGLVLTPLYVAFHGASFDAFDVGQVASPGIEALAELGNPAVVRDERLAADPNSVGGVLTAPGGFAGAPLIEPQETTSGEFHLNGALNTYFSFLSMILPSNDTFIGRDDAIRIFSDSGVFLGPRIISVTGLDIWDAGTEALGVDDAPFIPGGVGTNGTETDDVIARGQSLQDFAGITLPNGQILDASLIDFLANPEDFSVATITIEEVPSPATIALFLVAVAGIAYRKKAR